MELIYKIKSTIKLKKNMHLNKLVKLINHTEACQMLFDELLVNIDKHCQ
jgi:hypothetical protein